MITSNARTAPPPPAIDFTMEPEVIEAMAKPLPTTRESVLTPDLCPTCGAPVSGRLMVTHIQALVAAYYRLSVRDIMSPTRGTKAAVEARQVAMYLSYELTKKSLPEIGIRFGRDHTTIIHAIRQTQRRMLEDAEIEADVKALRERLAA